MVSSSILSDFEILGFRWDRSSFPEDIPTRSVRRACFPLRRAIPELAWSLLKLDESPISYPEVMTLASGVTIGGRRLEDVQEAISLITAIRKLLDLCEQQKFSLGKHCFCVLHAEVSKDSTLDPGVFRGEGEFSLGVSPKIRLNNGQTYRPLAVKQGGDSLSLIFSNGLSHIGNLPPFQRALVFFLFASFQMFFLNRNKRTAYLMMNGMLMSHGFDPLILTAEKLEEFKTLLLEFYESKDGTNLLFYLGKLHKNTL